jgi:opacity protein-like surface antigen
MMKVRAFLLGMATTAALGAAAHAADMPDNWGYQKPEPRFVEMVSGWYIRGDVGYRFNHVSSFEAPNSITDSKYTDSAGFTFGGGYKYQWFRSDVTLDYAPRVGAQATSSLAAVTQPQYTMKLSAVSVLANVYIDLGTWWGFTPYVGGGAGVSYLRGREYTDMALLPVNYAITNDRTTFSWAAMAGVSYRISPRWLVDVGYRHLNLGDLPTSTGRNDQTWWQGLSSDEVRVGFRFILD